MLKETNFITANNILFGNSFGKASTLTQIQNDILSDFEDFPSYQTVTINNTSREVQIVTITNNLTKDNYKKVLSKPNETFNEGDVLVWNNMTFVIIDIDEDQQVQTIGKIQLCNNTLTLNKNNTTYTIPCIVESSIQLYRMQLDENKYLSTLDDNIIVRVPNNSTTSLIEINDIYKIGKYNYKVTNMSDVVESGLLVLKMVIDYEQQVIPTYSLTILNGSSIQIAQSQSLTINVQVTEDGVVIPSPSLLFISSDEDILTISSSGVVTIKDVGTATVSVSLTNDNTVTDSIVVAVVAESQNNYTVQISGSNSIIKGNTSSYTCTFKNNGVQISDNSIFYLTADDGVSSTNLASISSQDNTANNCVVMGNNFGYVKLWVKNDDETIVSQAFRIQIKNIF